MAEVTTTRWKSLERWSPRLFFLAAVFLLVYASHRGVALLMDGFTYNDWFYPAILFGRLTALLAIGGLSVQIVNRNPRLGKLGRVVVSVAVMFTLAFLTLAIMNAAGFTSRLIGVFGLGTFVLSVITFSLFGVAIIRTGAYSASIGGLLLAVTVTLLALFVGLTVLPSGVMGTVGEGVLFALFLAIGYRLRTEPAPADHAEPPSDMAAR